MDERMGKVMVAMSGGVDSSTAAALLVRQGREVVGAAMRLPALRPEGGPGPCCGADAIRDARAVARKLAVPFHVLDLRAEFERDVLDYFRREYLRGRTPNPCVRCNRLIKFGALVDRARELGCDLLATGHYAQVRRGEESGRWELHAAPGEEDQSYFLYALSQEQLAHALFPVGDRTKEEVRVLASELGVPRRDRPPSQDLCFLAEGTYRQVLRRECPELLVSGEIVHVSGEVLGRHEGIAGYTVGQRRGLKVAWSEPLYVVTLEPETHRVIVGEKEHVVRDALEAAEVNWVSSTAPREPLRAEVRIRHRHRAASATVEPQGRGRVQVRFDAPQEAPTPGQAAVWYRGGCVLGGGTIEKVLGTRAAGAREGENAS